MTKLCECCRTPLVRKRFPSGRMERPAQFEARRFCDIACRNMTVKPKQPASHPWKQAGELVSQRRRRRMEAGNGKA